MTIINNLRADVGKPQLQDFILSLGRTVPLLQNIFKAIFLDFVYLNINREKKDYNLRIWQERV